MPVGGPVSWAGASGLRAFCPGDRLIRDLWRAVGEGALCSFELGNIQAHTPSGAGGSRVGNRMGGESFGLGAGPAGSSGAAPGKGGQVVPYRIAKWF